MNNKYCQIAYAVVIKFWSVCCNAYRNIDSLDTSELGLRPLAWPSVNRRPASPSLLGSIQFLLSVILNTFTFESEKLRVIYRIVGINRYQSVTDCVFGNRLSDRVFSIRNLPTSCFLRCRYALHIYAPDSVLSFLLQNRHFVGIVGKNQIM